MTDQPPLVAARYPAKLRLEAGKTYLWCRCGRSRSQPFCDDSHKGTGLSPVEFEPRETAEVLLCQCKATADQPFCDGTHRLLGDAQPGTPVPEIARDGPPRAVPTPEEPTVALIHQLAREGLTTVGPHGPIGAMGVPRHELPEWKDIQILAGQLARKPLLDAAPVAAETVIGPTAQKPLTLSMPLLVSDMSFGALSREAKIALAAGAQLAGTGICSGEGGMLPAEQAENSRYFYELASARFGWSIELVDKVQAFHFKGGQGAKTGTGGHLPASKVTEEIAAVRGLEPGQDAVSPATFEDLRTVEDYRQLAEQVRQRAGGIPIGFKLSANHIEEDIDFALEVGADYIILDGRGGATGAAPLLFRDNISVPTIPALARARRHLDAAGSKATLVITGGLRVPEDFVKALALGADAIAIANSAIQAVGCVAARICHTNNCPSGVATQRPDLRARLDPRASAARLGNFLQASMELMKVMARACGHDSLAKFQVDDLTTWKREMAELTGIRYGGVGF
jgi:glutamate synthase domain-containing protein 2/CDGSH-type Zn-finger protein